MAALRAAVAAFLAAAAGDAFEDDGVWCDDGSCEAALELRQLRSVRRHGAQGDDGDDGDEPSAGGNGTWAPWEEALSRPSTYSPLRTFYMYRAVGDDAGSAANTNAANLPGVLWYLHHNIVGEYPRGLNVTSIERLRVQTRATKPLLRSRMQFGPHMAMDRGRCMGPFVCGRQAGSDGKPEPRLCEGPYDPGREAEILPASGKPYGMPFEYGRYGFNVGCSNLDEYPSPEDAAYYPGGILYTLPGPCPTKGSAEADPECTLAEPGGLCEGEPTGAGKCTWSYEPMGKVSLDDLVGVSVDRLHTSGGREYDPVTDKGVRTNFWDSINSTEANLKRIQALRQLFAARFPDQRSEEEMRAPRCDFNFRGFYSEFWWRAPFEGECRDARMGDRCYTMVRWGMKALIYSHPEYFPGLTRRSSFKEFQQLLYMQGRAACPYRPCGLLESRPNRTL